MSSLKSIFIEKISHKVVEPKKGLDGPVFQYNNETYEIKTIKLGPTREEAEIAADKLLYDLTDNQYVVWYQTGIKARNNDVRLAVVNGLED